MSAVVHNLSGSQALEKEGQRSMSTALTAHLAGLFLWHLRRSIIEEVEDWTILRFLFGGP